MINQRTPSLSLVFEYKKMKNIVVNVRHILKLEEELRNTNNPDNATKIKWANKTLSELDYDKANKLKRVQSTLQKG